MNRFFSTVLLLLVAGTVFGLPTQSRAQFPFGGSSSSEEPAPTIRLRSRNDRGQSATAGQTTRRAFQDSSPVPRTAAAQPAAGRPSAGVPRDGRPPGRSRAGRPRPGTPPPGRPRAGRPPAGRQPVGPPPGVRPGRRLPPTGPIISGPHRKRVRDYSWIYIDPPEPREIQLHDIVTIIVDEKSEVIMNSRFNRRKDAELKAELREFVRIGDDGNLKPAALNGPMIDTEFEGNLDTTGQLTDQEGIKYRIAATVVDVLPNGVLQLEARKVIQTQDDLSEYTLSGELRASDVQPDNTASSENIANLKIVKRQKGRVYDSTKRNWGYRLYDLLSPF